MPRDRPSWSDAPARQTAARILWRRRPAECRERDELELLVGLDALDQPGPHLGTLTPGMSVDVEGPLGAFTFPSAAGRTPVSLRRRRHRDRAASRDAARGAGAPGARRRLALIYSARTPQEFAYGPELRALAAAGRLTLWQTVDAGSGRALGWRRRAGIALGHLRSMLHDVETLCFLCGPHALVHEISPLLEQLGIAPERVRVEEWKANAESECGVRSKSPRAKCRNRTSNYRLRIPIPHSHSSLTLQFALRSSHFRVPTMW